MLNAEKLKKIKEFIELSKSSLTEEEFVKSFKLVIDVVKKAKEEMNLAMESLNSKYTAIVNSIKDNYGGDMISLKQQAMSYCETEIGKITKQVDKKLAEVQDGRAGVDASVEEAALKASKLAQDALKPFIPTIEAIEGDLPKLGDKIAGALELLPDGDKLKVEAIQDLRKELDELRQIKTQRLGGGGFSKIHLEQKFIDDETPVGDVNGINTDFTVNNTPNPTASLKVYVNGQRVRITEDYTFTAKTITFLTAPPTGSIILVDYRK